MKARSTSLRWLATMVMTSMRIPAAALCLALAGLSAPALAAEPTALSTTTNNTPTTEPAEPTDRAPVGRNAIVLGTHAKIPDWATSVGYQRALGRRFSVGGALEYGYQVRGYWHLQGVSETLFGQVWLGRTFHGVFAEASLTAAHQFLVRKPSLSTTAIVPGVGLGVRWTHRSGLLLGASGGLRWGREVDASDIVCTRAKYCTSVREGAYTRITADIGFVF